ncbi:MAG: DinB family protein [Fibrobacterota bacterium]
MTEKFKAYLEGITQLESILKGLSKAQLSYRIAENKWNINEIVAHLADTEIQAYTRFRSILADDTPFFINHNEDKWATLLDHKNTDVNESLSAFKMIRGMNDRLIQSLDDNKLQMEGLHSKRGRITILDLIEGHIRHLENHVGQMSRNIDAQKMAP